VSIVFDNQNISILILFESFGSKTDPAPNWDLKGITIS